MITAEQLEESFRTASDGEGGHGSVRRRLLPHLQLDVFTEVRLPDGEWALLVIGTERLEDRDLILTAGLTCRARGGTIEVVASRGTDRPLFCTLLADLVQQLSVDTGAPIRTLINRLTAWQRMLSRGLPTGLSPTARLGLYGELLVLREIAVPALGPAAVAAWTGPMRTVRDFAHLSVALEVKTVSAREPDQCRISQEGQLDASGVEHLFLVHQVVGNAPDGTLIEEIIDELRADPRVATERSHFEEVLLEAGWLDVHRDQYRNERYALARRRCFLVDEAFPRIVPPDLPAGVSGVSYLVDLSRCEQQRVGEHALQDALTAPGAVSGG
jgi:hypothetical protein